MGKKFGLAITFTVICLLVFAGLYSLITGRSVVHSSKLDPTFEASYREFDSARLTWVANNPGLYMSHPDPMVGYVFKGETDIVIGQSVFKTDRYGMRRRSGPPPADSAFRIVVLGDSVAFGDGLNDEDCLANQMEKLIRDVRGTDALPVECYTVAVSGWNYRNAVHYLLDHYDRYNPDAVIYIPICNDLINTDLIYETGHRHMGFDPGVDDPWLLIHNGRVGRLWLSTVHRIKCGELSIDYEDFGPYMLNSDLGGESTRRYEDMASEISSLHGLLKRGGGELFVLQYYEEKFSAHYSRHLLEMVPDIAMIPFLRRIVKKDTLGHDAHPNRDTIRTMAIWIVQELMDRGNLDPGAGNPLPEVDAELKKRRTKIETPTGLQTICEQLRRKDHDLLKPIIDIERGIGINQIYGGATVFRNMGPRLLAAVAPVGDGIRITLAPIPHRKDLYPLTIQVEIDGMPAGKIKLEATDDPQGVSSEFNVPILQKTIPGSRLPAPIEIKLSADRWVIVEEVEPELVTCKFLRLECFKR